MRALDLSFPQIGQPVTPDYWRAVKSEGYELAVIGLWGAVTPNTEAEKWLREAREAGLLTACYVAINGSRPGWEHVDIGRGYAGDEWEHCHFCAIDVEVEGVTLPQITQAIQRVVELGKSPILYTARWFWRDRLGDPTGFSNTPLWTADYDNDPTLDFPLPYGGWDLGVLCGKQFSDAGNIWGVTFDINTFDGDWLEALRMPAEVTQTPQDTLAALEAAFNVMWRVRVGRTARAKSLLTTAQRWGPTQVRAVAEAWNAHAKAVRDG